MDLLQIPKEIWVEHIFFINTTFSVLFAKPFLINQERKYLYDLKHTLKKLRQVSKAFKSFFTCKEFWYPMALWFNADFEKISKMPAIPNFEDTKSPFNYMCINGMKSKIRRSNKKIGSAKRRVSWARAKVQKIKELIEEHEKKLIPSYIESKNRVEYQMLKMQVQHFEDFRLGAFPNK